DRPGLAVRARVNSLGRDPVRHSGRPITIPQGNGLKERAGRDWRRRMVPASRSHRLAGTLALAALFVTGVGSQARAQLYDYNIRDDGASGALGTAVARLGDIDGDGCEDFVVGEPNLTVSGVPGTGIVRLESGKTGSQMEQLLGNPGANYVAAVTGKID